MFQRNSIHTTHDKSDDDTFKYTKEKYYDPLLESTFTSLEEDN